MRSQIDPTETLDRLKTVEQFVSLRTKPVKIGAKFVSFGHYVTFQMAQVAMPRTSFADILWLIAKLRPPPAAAPA